MAQSFLKTTWEEIYGSTPFQNEAWEHLRCVLLLAQSGRILDLQMLLVLIFQPYLRPWHPQTMPRQVGHIIYRLTDLIPAYQARSLYCIWSSGCREIGVDAWRAAWKQSCINKRTGKVEIPWILGEPPSLPPS